MLRFTIGYFAFFLGLFVFNLFTEDWYRWYGALDYLSSIVFLCGIPTVCALAVTVTLNHRRPRKLFDPDAGHHVAPFFRGFLAAMLAVVISIPIVVFGDNHVGDVVLLGFASMVATGSVVFFATPRKPGHCIGCGYDLRCSLDTGRCPECGSTISKLMSANE